MKRVRLGQEVPDFSLPSTGGQPFVLQDLRGSVIVLYFYPRDDTPGCTLEGQQFQQLHARFRRAKARVYGISRDSLASHSRFCTKLGFGFDLLSDVEEQACKLFDVIREKTLYGRKYLGIERSSFVIDAQGRLRHEWRKVKVEGHAAEVLEAVKSL